MYLSDRDLQWAVESGKLIVDPPPTGYDHSSIDLHLDDVSQAKVWDVRRYADRRKVEGDPRPEVRIGTYNYAKFSRDLLVPPPRYDSSIDQLVGIRDRSIIVKPLGFVLWQTRERVGTPDDKADLICFVDGKSTRARAGIVVHLTAPTIHTSWVGKITLEIVNFGPFDLVLAEGDVIAQIVVAKVTSSPRKDLKVRESATHHQQSVSGTPES